MRTLLAVAVFALAACSSEPRAAAPVPAKKSEAPKPADETRRFPKANFVDSKVVDRELMGKAFMPGGTLASYKKGASEFELFLAKAPSANDAAIALSDWQKALSGAKLVPSFGGYFGQDGGRPVFVFSKGSWIAGVAGLSEKEADAVARTFAGLLN